MYAMLLARFKMFPEVKEKGMSSVPRLVAFTSEHVGAHVSYQVNYLSFISFDLTHISHRVFLLNTSIEPLFHQERCSSSGHRHRECHLHQSRPKVMRWLTLGALNKTTNDDKDFKHADRLYDL